MKELQCFQKNVHNEGNNPVHRDIRVPCTSMSEIVHIGWNRDRRLSSIMVIQTYFKKPANIEGQTVWYYNSCIIGEVRTCYRQIHRRDINISTTSFEAVTSYLLSLYLQPSSLFLNRLCLSGFHSCSILLGMR